MSTTWIEEFRQTVEGYWAKGRFPLGHAVALSALLSALEKRQVLPAADIAFIREIWAEADNRPEAYPAPDVESPDSP